LLHLMVGLKPMKRLYILLPSLEGADWLDIQNINAPSWVITKLMR